MDAGSEASSLESTTAGTQESQTAAETAATESAQTVAAQQTDETEQAAETAETSPGKQYFTAVHASGKVRIHSTASLSGSIIGFLLPGDQGDVIGTSGGFTQISFEGKTGYVGSVFLSISSDAPTASTETAETTAN